MYHVYISTIAAILFLLVLTGVIINIQMGGDDLDFEECNNETLAIYELYYDGKEVNEKGVIKDRCKTYCALVNCGLVNPNNKTHPFNLDIIDSYPSINKKLVIECIRDVKRYGADFSFYDISCGEMQKLYDCYKNKL